MPRGLIHPTMTAGLIPGTGGVMPDDPGAVVDSPQPDVNAAPSAEEVPVAPLTDCVAEGSPQSPPPASADVPFHQHPRWIERQQELERERAARVALEQQNRLLME